MSNTGKTNIYDWGIVDIIMKKRYGEKLAGTSIDTLVRICYSLSCIGRSYDEKGQNLSKANW